MPKAKQCMQIDLAVEPTATATMPSHAPRCNYSATEFLRKTAIFLRGDNFPSLQAEKYLVLFLCEISRIGLSRGICRVGRYSNEAGSSEACTARYRLNWTPNNCLKTNRSQREGGARQKISIWIWDDPTTGTSIK